MYQGRRVAVVVAAMIAVGASVTWWSAAPQSVLNQELPQGTLAQAVQEQCDPSRKATFTGTDLDKAVVCQDLAAQTSMALSTERVVWLGWAQLGVAVGGSAAVLWTVLIAINSMALTRQALQHQQTATRLTLRPRLISQPLIIDIEPNGKMAIDFNWKNDGAMTAINFRCAFIWKVVDREKGQSKLDASRLHALMETNRIVPPGAESGRRIVVTKRSADEILNLNKALQIAFFAIFDDELGGKYYYVFRREYSGRNLARHRAISDFKLDARFIGERDA
nr:hypothetical protein [uncultured Brevundimonas sp.]